MVPGDSRGRFRSVSRMYTSLLAVGGAGKYPPGVEALETRSTRDAFGSERLLSPQGAQP